MCIYSSKSDNFGVRIAKSIIKTNITTNRTMPNQAGGVRR